MANSTTPPSRPRRRWVRRLLISGGVLTVVVVVLVALLPWLITQGLANRWIESRASDAIAGSVTFDSLRIGWNGPQIVRGVRIIDHNGNNTTDITVTINSSLTALLFDPAVIPVTISGNAHLTRRADGSINLVDAVQPASPSTPSAPSSPTRLPVVLVTLNSFGVTLTDEATSDRYELVADNLTARYAQGTKIEVDGNGEVSLGDGTGTWSAKWMSDDPIDAGGAINLAGMYGGGQITISQLPIKAGEQSGTLDRLVINATATDITDELHVTVDMRGDVDPARRTTMLADVRIARPFSVDGTMTISPQHIVGTVSAQDLSTQLLEPFLVGTALRAQRDIGPTVSIEASHDPQSPTPLAVSMQADRVDVQFRADVDADGRVQTNDSVLTAHLDPQLLADLIGVRASGDVPVSLHVNEMSIERRGDGYDPASLATSMQLLIEGEHAFAMDALDQPPFAISATQFDLNTDRLGGGLSIRGGAMIDGAQLTIDQHVSGYMDGDGAFAFDLDQLIAVGSIALIDVSPTWLDRRLPELRTMIEPFWTAPATLVVQTEQVTAGVLSATVDISTGVVTADAEIERRPDGLTITAAQAAIDATPEVAAALFNAFDFADAPQLLDPTTVRIALDPITIAGAEPGEYDFTTISATGSVISDPIAVAHVPGLAHAISLQGAQGTFDVRRTADTMRVTGDVGSAVHLHGNATPAALIQSTYAWNPDAVASVQLDAHIEQIDVAAVEMLFDQDEATLSNWVGDRATVIAEVRHAPTDDHTSFNAHVVADQLSTRAAATVRGGMLNFSADDTTLTIPANRMQALVAGTAADGEAPLLTVTQPVTLTATIPSLQVPLAMVRATEGETGDAAGFDSTDVRLDAGLTVSPLTFTTRDGGTTTIDGVSCTLKTGDLNRGIDYALKGSIRPTHTDATAAAPAIGTIDFTGRLRHLLSDAGVLDLSEPRVNLTGSASGLPTALIDVLANMDGLLVDALGPSVSLTAKTSAGGLSLYSGAVDVETNATHGSAKGRILGRNGMLRIVAEAPLTAELELTPPIRARLLKSINPILSDLRSTEQPLRVTVSAAHFPVDGDLSKLHADLTIETGAVALDSGSATLAIMRAFQQPQVDTVPAVIEPIVARIRAGVLTYERFAFRVDQYAIAFSGRIDLTTQAIDLRWHVPLAALGQHVREVRGLPDQLAIPLRTRGSLQDYSTAIDPDFDIATELIKHGIGGAIRKQLEGGDGNPLDTIRDILDRPRSEQREPRGTINPLGGIIRDALRPRNGEDG